MAIAVVGVAGGCGSDDAADPKLALAGADTPEQQAQLTCAQNALVAPAGQCEGPWKYRNFVSPCYASKRDASCGVESYKNIRRYTFRECRWKGAGIERLRKTNCILGICSPSLAHWTTTTDPVSHAYAAQYVYTAAVYSGGSVTPATNKVYYANAFTTAPATTCGVPTPATVTSVNGTSESSTCTAWFNTLKESALAQFNVKQPDGTWKNTEVWNTPSLYGGGETYEGSYGTIAARTVSSGCTTCMSVKGCSWQTGTGYNGYPTYANVQYGGTVPSGKAGDSKFCDINIQRYRLGVPPPRVDIMRCGADGKSECGGEWVLDANGAPRRDVTCPVDTSDTFVTVVDQYNACRVGPDLDEDPGACGLAEGDVYAAVRPADARQNATCSTLNADRPLTTQEMYTQLIENLTVSATGVDQTALRNTSIRKLKLLLELRGDELTQAQRDVIYGYVQSRPELTPPCGTSWTSPGTAVPALDASMQICHRSLLYPSSVATSAAKMAAQCVDAGKATTTLTSSDPRRPQYLDAYRAKVLPFLEKVLAIRLPHVAERVVNTELQDRLALIDAWSGYADATYPDRDAQWEAARAIVGATWNGIYADSQAAFRAKTSPNSDDVQQLAVESLKADRELLYAMFSDRAGSSGPPLNDAPALFFLSDAMRALTERLDAFAPYHNLGCQYVQCAQKGLKTELAALIRVLSAMGNSRTDSATGVRSFADALAEAKGFRTSYSSNFSSNGANWQLYADVFDKIASRHAQVIQAAVVDAAGVSPFDQTLVLLPDPNGARPVLALQGEVVKSAQRWNSFAASGLLFQRDVNVLHTGLLASNIASAKQRLSDSVNALDRAIADYRQTQPAAIQSLVTQIDTQQATENLRQRGRVLAKRVADLASDEEGLRIGATLDEAAFADMTRVVANAARESGAKYLESESLGPIFFDGRDGRYQGRLGYDVTIDVPSVAKRGSGPIPATGIVMQGQPGTVVLANVSGKYQPTCSLLDLGGDLYGVGLVESGLASAATGSYGFGMEFTEGKMKTHEYSSSDADAVWVKLEACLNASTGFDAGVGGVQATVSACVGFSKTHTETEVDSHGTQARTAATFSVGVRLPNTPFPNYPAGALLAVFTRPGAYAVTDILDVQVVGEPTGSLVFRDAADLYFVVNDRQCTNSADAQKLRVDLAKLTPVSGDEAVPQLMRAFDTAGSYLDGKTTEIVRQGRVLQNQLLGVRNGAIALFEAEGDFTLASFPKPLATFFESWLDSRIRNIDRQVELVAIHREMDQIKLEAQAIDADLGLQDQKGRHTDVLPLLALRNLEYSNEELTQAMGIVVDKSNQLYPMAYLRYPETFSYVTGATSRLLALNWLSAPLGGTSEVHGLDTLARSVKIAADDILRALQEAADRSTDLQLGDAKQKLIAVHFPNPWNPPPPGHPLLPYPGAFVDYSRSAPVWEAILQGLYRPDGSAAPPIQFEIRPEDIYTANGGNATQDGLLNCSAVAPTIKSMHAYFVTPVASTDADVDEVVNALNSFQYSRPITVRGYMNFVTVNGPEPFRMENVDHLQVGEISATYGSELETHALIAKVGRDAPEVLSRSVQGVSPFTSFQFASFDGRGDPFYEYGEDPLLYQDGSLRIVDFVVLMNLEYRATSRVHGVSSCP
jgi:hypothetical protein